MGESSLTPKPSTVGLALTGRSTLVTVAASGIGRACAERLARAWCAAVTVLDLDGEAARRVADGFGGEAIEADLSDYGVLDALEVEADIVVNNAGLQHVVAVEEFPPERFSMILRGMLEAPSGSCGRRCRGCTRRDGDARSTSRAYTGCEPPRTNRLTSRPSTAWRASRRSWRSKGGRAG